MRRLFRYWVRNPRPFPQKRCERPFAAPSPASLEGPEGPCALPRGPHPGGGAPDPPSWGRPGSGPRDPQNPCFFVSTSEKRSNIKYLRVFFSLDLPRAAPRTQGRLACEALFGVSGRASKALGRRFGARGFFSWVFPQALPRAFSRVRADYSAKVWQIAVAPVPLESSARVAGVWCSVFLAQILLDKEPPKCEECDDRRLEGSAQLFFLR